MGERVITGNGEVNPSGPYSNKIITSKYNIINFLPLVFYN